MTFLVLTAALLALASTGYYMGRSRALRSVTAGGPRLNSLPSFYGHYVALWCGLPALLVVAAWLIFEPSIIRALVIAGLPETVRDLDPARLDLLLNDVRNVAAGGAAASAGGPEVQAAAERYATLRAISFWAMTVSALALAVVGLNFARNRVRPELRARAQVEQVIKVVMMACSAVAIITTIGIVLSLIFEAGRFFVKVSPVEFLFGTEWSPQIALRADQVGSAGVFGAVPLFVGTLLISFIAMCVAMPVGLFAAIYTAEYAHPRMRAIIKPVLEILAGIPTVVYGFFAALTVAPFFRNVGEGIGLQVSSESALAAGIVMGVMIIPFVSSLSDDVITAVPQSMREGSYGLGSTQSEMIRKVILPAALPGIVGGFLLAISRAIGETMIVVMAAGLAANLTANPLEAVTTITVQIVTLLVGDQEFDSPKTLAAFALGLVLFCVTLVLNVVALHIVNKYREQYE